MDIRAAIDKSIYVFRACRKPSIDELVRDFKIIVIGIFIIGIIGFVVHIAFRYGLA